MKSAYFQCIGGASGDMILGAVVDAGVSLDALKESLAKMDANGYELTERKAQRGGLQGTQINVELDDGGRKKRRWQDFVRIVEESGLSYTTQRPKRRICMSSERSTPSWTWSVESLVWTCWASTGYTLRRSHRAPA